MIIFQVYVIVISVKSCRSYSVCNVLPYMYLHEHLASHASDSCVFTTSGRRRNQY